jgi:putative effector of murein hydrolase
MTEIFHSPLFGITLSIVAFSIGLWINRRVKSALANPLIIAMLLVIATLVIFDIPLDAYEEGSSFIHMFLAPVTAVLALTIWRQKQALLANLLPITLGTLVGSAAAITTVLGLSALLGVDDSVLASLLSKSVTTPVAVAITEQLGGLPALTIASTVITGLTGNLLAPMMIKLFSITDPIAQGVGIGCSSHALGTSKALEIGEVQGAMSSISITLSAFWTVLLIAVFF